MLIYQSQLKQLLHLTIKQGASDLHISVGHPPILRKGGKITPVPNRGDLSAKDCQGLAFSLMDEVQKEKFLITKEIDFSYSLDGEGRFRVNIFFQSGSIACALRLIPNQIRTIEELNMPPILHRFTEPTQGFILITGPSSHGKSTTLAALIDEINHTKAKHIITIEDPVEYIFEDDKCVIDQRELGHDTLSFSKALRSTFRQDPDIIMVGEMRGSETISTAITAAETGHLVFATLHTNSAAQTIHRIVDNFSGEQQAQVRAQLSGSLLGVISQRLVPGIRGDLIPACEIMLKNPAIANLIRENKIHEIPMIIETSKDIGMNSLNRSLAEKVMQNKVSKETAMSYSLDPKGLKLLLQ
jgi:twitching motility protein PilT